MFHNKNPKSFVFNFWGSLQTSPRYGFVYLRMHTARSGAGDVQRQANGNPYPEASHPEGLLSSNDHRLTTNDQEKAHENALFLAYVQFLLYLCSRKVFYLFHYGTRFIHLNDYGGRGESAVQVA